MLSTLERRIVAGVVLAGVLVLAGAVWAFVNRDRVEVWLNGDDVAAAHRAVMTAELPAGLEDDPTLSACEPWSAVRCAWSDAGPEEAAQLMADGFADAGLDVREVVCGAEAPASSTGSGAVCAAEVPVAGERMWIVTTDRTPVGHEPLTRTAAWIVWDEESLSPAMTARIAREWFGTTFPVPPVPLAVEELADALPARFEPLLAGPCQNETPDGCLSWEGEVDLGDLGDDPVPALVAELTAAGYFVDAAEPGSVGVRAHRFVDGTSRQGLWVSVRLLDGTLVGRVLVL